MKYLSRFPYILQQECLLNFNNPVVVGVSGGPDSLFLLDILWRAGYPVVVAHLNHHLRSEANAEAICVAEAARDRKLPFVIDEVDVPVFARNNVLSIEEAARTVRYRFLFKQALQYKAQAVAVAHTADDQVETVLMHLLRGTGLSGLKGMNFRSLPNPWSDTIPLVRPLLSLFRENIIDYCTQVGLNPVFDRSNFDTTYLRNRLRHELIPTLGTYNPNIKNLLLRMTQTLASDEQTLEYLTEVAWHECCLVSGRTWVSLKVDGLLTHPLGIQRRLLRRSIELLRPGLRDIDFETVERALSFLKKPSRSGKIDLANRLNLILEENRLWVVNWDCKLPTDKPQILNGPLVLTIPGRVELSDGRHIIAEPVINIPEATALAQANTDPTRAWIDLSDLFSTVLVRSCIKGDRFQPVGMNGHTVKLSDYFINKKIQHRVRRYWPLICIGDEIAWIPGFCVAHPYRLTSSSTRAVYLYLSRG